MCAATRNAVVGCLLDVSGSMRDSLDSKQAEEHTLGRLHIILGTALQIAKVEYQNNQNALMFIGIFGLDTEKGGTSTVDLCAVAQELLAAREDERTGHEQLIDLANKKGLTHVTQYIERKLEDDEAHILHIHLRQDPSRVDELVKAIPGQSHNSPSNTLGAAQNLSLTHRFLDWTPAAVADAAERVTKAGRELAVNYVVDNSEGLKLAHRMCNNWLLDFSRYDSRPVYKVIDILSRLQESRSIDGERDGGDLLKTLSRYMYGSTPLSGTLSNALETFNQYHQSTRTLILVSDGISTDGNPLEVGVRLREAGVNVVTVYLADNNKSPTRRLYDHVEPDWHQGQRVLLNMATRISADTHPIPVLAMMGWEIPLSGQCALHVQLCSSAMLKEFCELLLSARFGSADALLGLVGIVWLDKCIDGEHTRTRGAPSDQGNEGSCYAHAIASLLHMALCRIKHRDGGHDSIEEIRSRILREHPPGTRGQDCKAVLEETMTWYRPLRYKEVTEEDARRAVLRRRPVLATFYLSKSGWGKFCKHFEENSSTRRSVLTRDMMADHRALPQKGGHAVILVRCDPNSLTFLNSWGKKWGKRGSFRIEDAAVLELDDPSKGTRMRFYDVYWLEKDLTPAEREAYNSYADSLVQASAKKHRAVFNLPFRCPMCKETSPIADFKGSLRQATCSLCSGSFKPEPGHLAQTLYARAGLG